MGRIKKNTRGRIGAAIMWAVLSLFLLAAPASADDAAEASSGKKESKSVFSYPIRFFKKYISPADGDRCPMYPSCSEYAVQAFQKHGALRGSIMTCDRLMRCGRDELKISPSVRVNGKSYCYDPVEHNDVWW